VPHHAAEVVGAGNRSGGAFVNRYWEREAELAMGESFADKCARLERENAELKRKARALELIAEAEGLSVDEACEFAENHPGRRGR
jgi:hypothetical protein